MPINRTRRLDDWCWLAEGELPKIELDFSKLDLSPRFHERLEHCLKIYLHQCHEADTGPTLAQVRVGITDTKRTAAQLVQNFRSHLSNLDDVTKTFLDGASDMDAVGNALRTIADFAEKLDEVSADVPAKRGGRMSSFDWILAQHVLQIVVHDSFPSKESVTRAELLLSELFQATDAIREKWALQLLSDKQRNVNRFRKSDRDIARLCSDAHKALSKVAVNEALNPVDANGSVVALLSFNNCACENCMLFS